MNIRKKNTLHNNSDFLNEPQTTDAQVFYGIE